MGRRDRFVADMDQVAPWDRLCAMIEPVRRSGSCARQRVDDIDSCPSKSRTFLVATVAPRERAVAATWQSACAIGWRRERSAAILAWARPASLSKGRTWPANNSPKARSAAASATFL